MNNEVFGTGVSIKAKVDGDYITIGCASSIAFNYENEIIGKTDVNAGLFRKKRVRISDCRGSVSGIITTSSTATRLSVVHFLQEAIRRSEIDMQFVFQDPDANVIVIQGLFLVASEDLTSEAGAWAEFSLTLEGTGGIEVTEIAPPGDLVCEQIFSDWWTTTPGETAIGGFGNEGLTFAGHDVIEVDRTGFGGLKIITSGTPGNAEAKYTGGSTISFDPTNPFNAGEWIFVIWVEDGS